MPYPEGTVSVVFDNEQAVGKTYTVRRNNMNCPLSVITSFAYLCIDNTNLQNDFSLKPENWFFKDMSATDVIKIKDYPLFFKDFIRSTRNKFIEYRLRILAKSLKKDREYKVIDEIDIYAHKKNENENEKISELCGGANDSKYRNCTNCGGKLISTKLLINSDLAKYNVDPYKHFNNDIHPSIISVKVGESDKLSSSGFENIANFTYSRT